MNPEADNNLEEWEAKLAEYTLGVMEAEAASEFGRQLAECRTHVTLAQQYTQVVDVLGYAASSAEPPSGHKARLMAHLASAPQETRVADAAAIPAPAPIALPTPTLAQRGTSPAAIAPGTDGASTSAQISDLGEYRERKRARLSLPAIAAIAAALVVLLGGAAWITSRLDSSRLTVPPEVVGFAVQGTGPQKDSSAVCLLNTKTNEAYLLTNGLQPISPQQVYELWWLPPKGDPVSAGTFTVDNTGKARHVAKAPASVAQYTGVAVTLEQAPGVSKPAGPIVLVGNYSVH